VAIADDTLNQLLASAWSAGALDATVAAAGGLVALFDDVELSPRLPPVLTASRGGSTLHIAIGDVDGRMVKRAPGAPAETVAALSLSAEVSVTVKVVGDQLTLIPHTPSVYVDLDDQAAAPLDAGSLRELGELVARDLVGVMSRTLAHVPLPAASGAMAVGARAGAVPAYGYVLVSGDVERR
jgi:hypothetical protein